jgi:hypothetical protein
MSNLLDLPPVLAKGTQVQHGRVQAITDLGQIEVRFAGAAMTVPCRVLHTGGSETPLKETDDVLVWLGDADECGAVVLGRIGLHGDGPRAVVAKAEFAARPQSLVIETQGDLVLRNGQARIKLGSEGDVEIVCTSFTTRSQRLLRLLAPFIKLN